MSVAGAFAWPVRAWPDRVRRSCGQALPTHVHPVPSWLISTLREVLSTPTEDFSEDLTASGNHALSMIGGSTAPRGYSAMRPGDGPTLSDLYYAHRLSLVRLAILLVDDMSSAEDVVQDSFTGLWRRYGEELRGLDNPLGYLRTAVVNNARSVLRRRKTAREYTPPHVPDAASAELADKNYNLPPTRFGRGFRIHTLRPRTASCRRPASAIWRKSPIPCAAITRRR